MKWDFLPREKKTIFRFKEREKRQKSGEERLAHIRILGRRKKRMVEGRVLGTHHFIPNTHTQKKVATITGNDGEREVN